MANIIEYGRRTITITPDGVNDFDLANETGFVNGIRLSAITFFPSAANDILAVRDKLVTGPMIYKFKDVVGGGIHQPIQGPSMKTKPYIKAADQTFGTASTVRIIFEYD